MPRVKFEYEYQDTPLHNMHPVTKLGIFMGLAAGFTVWLNPIYSIIPLVLSQYLWSVGKVPGNWRWIPLFWFIVTNINPMGSLTMSIPFLWQTSMYRFDDPLIFGTGILNAAWMGTPFLEFKVPDWIAYNLGLPGVGKFTPVALMTWLHTSINNWGLAAMATTLFYTTSVPDIVQFMLKLKVPMVIVFPLVTIFRFFPVLSEYVSQIINSQTLRGVSFQSKNPFTMLNRLPPLMEPIGRVFMKTTESITISVVNRAFGATYMSPHREMPWKNNEKIIVAICVSFALLCWYAALSWKVGVW